MGEANTCREEAHKLRQAAKYAELASITSWPEARAGYERMAAVSRLAAAMARLEHDDGQCACFRLTGILPAKKGSILPP